MMVSAFTPATELIQCNDILADPLPIVQGVNQHEYCTQQPYAGYLRKRC